MTGPARKRQKREDYRKAQAEQNGQIQMPKKKFYRQRAHANPFSDHALIPHIVEIEGLTVHLHSPASPQHMDWSTHFPAFKAQSTEAEGTPSNPPTMTRQVEIADIGCGFGGLVVALSPLFPTTLMIGMELRSQVTDYVINRIAALRSQNPHPPSTNTANTPPPYHNISAHRTNTMKFLPNYFRPSQLSHIFLCFPDPHFKQRKHKARIVSAQLNAEYAFVTRPGGKVYTITDVEELHLWMVRHFEGEESGDGRELWERVGEEELEGDVCVRVMSEETEEGKKVSRNGGRKYIAVFRRRGDPGWVGEV
ncbi:tRNA (guanine-N(7)-)-methyltransferase (tRNA(m7G46)-methyltransferase) [Knufia fluminis]|uniref:tRNA (guanine-N(7)-)-methyltransferase n=1 Tax=Knufia fluminis TaxID=191047 RepID=A0AAN8EF20_9EURO|nr:tRNA (guanine-N(7)-)-methyltransferase (tRNA(m7G46)-methyltransferase) [Knufia fluminis]